MMIVAGLVVLSVLTLVAAYLLGMHASSAKLREKTSEVFQLALPRRGGNGRSPLMLGADPKADAADESSRFASSAFFPTR